LTLRQLQFFVAAAQAGAVTGAARELSISHSSVTEAIRALEDDMGVQLFDRQARGLLITQKGSAFLRHARQILADVAIARTAFQDEAGPLKGRLSLGVTSLVAGYVFSGILQRFRRAHPQVELNVIEDNGDYCSQKTGTKPAQVQKGTGAKRCRRSCHRVAVAMTPSGLAALGRPAAHQ
jgi:DNA-binding transcriptional LysR family regulator